jgi:chromosome segregation ATPase
MKKGIKEWIYNRYFQDKIELIYSLHTELEDKEAQNKKLELEARHLTEYKDSLETELKKVVDHKDSLETELKKVVDHKDSLETEIKKLVDYKDNLEIEFRKVVDIKEKVEIDLEKIVAELRLVSEQSGSRIRELEEANREREAQIKRSIELLVMFLNSKPESCLGSFTYGDCICLIRLINNQNFLNVIGVPPNP